jgi:hypothetical protein
VVHCNARVQEAARIEIGITEEFVEISVEGVSTGFNDVAFNASSGVAELCGIAAGQNGHLYDRIRRKGKIPRVALHLR